MSPTLLFITDSFPNSNGAGISQTLYNLFRDYGGQMWILMPEDEIVPPANECILAKRITYKPIWRSPMRNRLGKLLNYLTRNFQFTLQSFKTFSQHLPHKEGLIIIVSTTDASKLHLAYLLSKNRGYAVVPYFMDDWVGSSTRFWYGRRLQKMTAYVLSTAKARLMISKQLKAILEERFKLPTVPTHIVHNPCPVIPHLGSMLDQKNLSASLIMYAGSIWPMHADALVATAKAIHLSHQVPGHKYNLHIYAPAVQWQNYSQQLKGAGVAYKGWLSYAEVLQEMPKAWLLLCTASFTIEYAPFSKSSVQTKLTDYIAAARPVMVVGPMDAASGEWVANNGCGLHFSNPDPKVLLKGLRNCTQNPEAIKAMAEQAKTLAIGTYAAQTVKQKLYQFLENII